MPFKKRTSNSTKKVNAMKLGDTNWDLYKDGLTQGSISLFLQCREQFRLAMVEGWTSFKGSTAIEFGSAFHHALSKLARDVSPAEALEDYMKTRPQQKMSAQDKEDLHMLLLQVETVLNAYVAYWGKTDKDKKWVAREETFWLNYPLSKVLEFDTTGRSIPLRGRWDGLFISPKSKKHLRLHETKTKGVVDADGIKAILPFDTQTMLYCLSAREHFQKPVDGTLYDVVRRPQLRIGKNESRKDFLHRIAQDIADRPEWYFHRWEVRITNKDLDEWERNQLIPVLRQIALWNEEKEKGIHHFMSPRALFTNFGRCDMFDLITAKNTYGLAKKKHPYPELID